MGLLKKAGILIMMGMASPYIDVSAQSTKLSSATDSIKKPNKVQQEDIVDVLDKTFKLHKQQAQDTNLKQGKIYPSVFPAIGYTITTSVTFILASNASFYLASPDSTNLSVISLNPLYSIQNQVIVPLVSDIWFKKNKVNLLGDYRYYKYPSVTYGLGGHTSVNNVDSIDYSYLSLSQEALYHVSHYIYAGIGYSFDYHYNITDNGNQPDFEYYEQNATRTVSSGVLLHVKYDSRANINNPKNAFYASIQYRDNLTVLGSDNNWKSIQLELRKYLKLFPRGNNVLALWSWNEFTFGGKVPYLDLPGTGWDTYSNSGRGYIQSRFRGTDMVYVESEYRFNITHNGLLGGVLFANAQAIPEWPSNRFESINPGKGIGLRIKINRYSDTNLCIDYGFGNDGSRGFYFNVGEVF